MLDISSNRKMKKYPLSIQLRRILWMFGWFLFRFSLRPCFGWRRFILRIFGARVGREVHIYPSAVIYFPWNLEIGDYSSIGEHAYIYNLGKVTVGKKVTVSQRAHLCAGNHDYCDPAMKLTKPPVTIEDQAWICADAFVGPGRTIGEGAVVAARAVAVKDVEPWTIVGGNPAKCIKTREMESRSLTVE